jgi:hypothetical protein
MRSVRQGPSFTGAPLGKAAWAARISEAAVRRTGRKGGALARRTSEIEVQCPCCDAVLVVDTNLGRVLSHAAPERGDKPELSEAARILEAEAARRESLFRESVKAEKSRDDVLSRHFEEALRQARDEPIRKPTRDFDLD